MPTLFVILPCYNEEENIGTLLSRWIDLENQLMGKGYKIHIIAVDDKSTDNTLSIIRGDIGGYDKITVLAHSQNKGLGGALLTGFDFFTGKSADKDIALVMDADNTHDPNNVFIMIDEIDNGSDCVIASRYCYSSQVVGLKKYRQFLTSCARYYYKIVLGIPNVNDYTCGYRVYKSSIIKKAYWLYPDRLITESSFACTMELLYKLYRIGAHISEVPFELRYDLKGGQSKMNVLKTIKASLITALRLKYEIKIEQPRVCGRNEYVNENIY